MNDLFPASIEPDALRFDGIRYAAPVFFAVYPAPDDLPGIVAWQRWVCRLFAPPEISLRPPELLHASVAPLGTPKRQRQSLEEAIAAAAGQFAFPAFDITLALTARLGAQGRAFAALADEASTRALHGLRLALAYAQEPFGLRGSRARSEAHLTLGYCDGLPGERLPIAPIRFRIGAVELVASHVGHSEHFRIDRWLLS